MSSLYYNHNLMQEQIIPNLNNTIDKLNQIINVRNGMFIPSSFGYKNTLKTILNDISIIKKSLNSEIDFINKSNKMLEEELQSIEKQFQLISNVENSNYIK